MQDESRFWIVPPDQEFRYGSDEEGSYLDFAFGARCPCWVRLRLLPDEVAALQGEAEGDGKVDPASVRRLIRDVHRREAEYRQRLQPR